MPPRISNIVKTKVGAPVPEGWKKIRETRTTQYIQKQVAPPTEAEVDDLISMFGKMGVSAQVVPQDELSALMSGMSIGGRKRKTRRRGKKRGTRKH
jgi:hypothetical protein